MKPVKKRLLKIAFFGTYPPQKGDSEYNFVLIKEMLGISKKIQIDVFCGVEKEKEEKLADSRIKIHHIFNPRSLLYPFRLFFNISKIKPDIFHAEYGPYGKLYGGWLGEPFLMLLILLKLVKIPSTMTLHLAWLRLQAEKAAMEKYRNKIIAKIVYYYFLVYSKILIKCLDLLQLSTTKIDSIFKATFIKDYNIKDVQKIGEFPHPCYAGIRMDRTLARNSLDLQENEFVIFNFGFISPRKGLQYLLGAGDLLKYEYNMRNFKIIIAGQPDNKQYLKSLNSFVIDKKIEDVVTIIPRFLSQEELDVYFSAADLFVFPYSQAIGVSGVIHKILYLGKPILTSSSGYHFKEDVDGALITVKTNDPRMLAEKIKNTIEDIENYALLKRKYINFYNLNTFRVGALRTLKYYINVIKKRS
jgi:glycosyltransferase involved in cell wall biosynthesis